MFTRRGFNRLALGTAAGVGAAALTNNPASATAQALPEGFTIQKSNIDQVLDATFEGKTIRSMLPPVLEMQVRKYNLKIPLRHSEEIPLDPRYLAWREKNRTSGKVTFDRSTRLVNGWEAGEPFPAIDPTDPDAGEKVTWNFFYGVPIGQAQVNQFAFIFVDGNSGVERLQHWKFHRFYMKGRWGDQHGKLQYGDGSEFHRTLLVANYPFDIKGVGTFGIRYDSKKYDDSWVYLRAVRRTRRLTGGSWMDPIGGSDQLNDDIGVFNAHPTWYPSYKLLGKRWVLAIAHADWPAWSPGSHPLAAEYPMMNVAEAPYWNPIGKWEPREVWVVESIAPSEHPYSKKIVYYETKHPQAYYAEAYDRKGELWKFINFPAQPQKGADGSLTVTSVTGHTIDFQRNHATLFAISPDSITNTLDPPESVTLGVLEREGGA